MNRTKSLIHDLSNIVTSLNHRACKLLEAAPQDLEAAELRHEAKAISLGLSRISQLTKELSQSTANVRLADINVLPVAELADHLDNHVLPLLTAVHGVDIELEITGSLAGAVVGNSRSCASIAENLVANAAAAGATRVTVGIGANQHTCELTFRDNGRGMTDAQLRLLGFGVSSKDECGHGQGFRQVRKLAADLGGSVSTPKSVFGFATEVVVTLMTVGGGIEQPELVAKCSWGGT